MVDDTVTLHCVHICWDGHMIRDGHDQDMVHQLLSELTGGDSLTDVSLPDVSLPDVLATEACPHGAEGEE